MSDPSQLLADEQTAAERRALRADYRAIYGKVVEGKEQLANAASADLRDVLGRVGALHARAQRPKEYAVDAEVFAQLAACGLDMVRRGAAQASKRTPADFVAQLRAAHGLRAGAAGAGGGAAGAVGVAASRASNANAPQMDWAALGLAAVASGVFAPAPGTSTMFGPLGDAPKPPSDKKKAAAAAAAAKRGAAKRSRLTAEEIEAAAGPKVVPREVTDDLGAANPDGDDKQETDRQMDAMWEALMERADPDAAAEEQAVAAAGEGGGRGGDDDEAPGASRTFVDVAALVINHESFAQTVENLFTLSFLVRDQRVRLEHDPALGLVVRPFSLEQQRAIKEGSAAEAAAVAAAVATGDTGAGGAGGAGGRTRGGGGRAAGNQQLQQAAQRQRQRQQQQRLAHQFVVRFTHEDWEIMKAIVPREQAVTPHRVLGERLANEDAREREAAREADAAAGAQAAAREAVRRQQDARDEAKRAAQRERRKSEREQLEKNLRALRPANGREEEEEGAEEHQEGDENVEEGAAGRAGTARGGGNVSGKKRAREAAAAAGGGGAGGDGGDDLDVVDIRSGSGKAMRVM